MESELKRFGLSIASCKAVMAPEPRTKGLSQSGV
ncbi:hypothetical protein T4A_12885 [Trichinella pseudospiralis]|uniref:Uncharacterized protein n=1 Tax=Trichinella pseudospiralis TaxID=6337 RepID=A0A0V1DNE4_TRIPS|nr:hypothetical protein T4A_12885 [Trichinella pseudospiralis]